MKVSLAAASGVIAKSRTITGGGIGGVLGHAIEEIGVTVDDPLATESLGIPSKLEGLNPFDFLCTEGPATPSPFASSVSLLFPNDSLQDCHFPLLTLLLSPNFLTDLETFCSHFFISPSSSVEDGLHLDTGDSCGAC